MTVEQLYTKCLAEAAYYIESNGEAVIIDPLRETQPYIDRAKQDNATIKYVFLTHFHADFVSGHVDLAQQTGATIVFGPNATTEFDIHSGTDGEEFKIGDVTLTLLHTPGHTMESSCYLLKDANGKETAVFTGDTLFIGDVGRPDLAVKSNLTTEDLAGHLYDSLRTKLMVLPDNVTVYPAHGAGSACGKNMSKETFDTLGNQKKVNYALQTDLSKEDFIKELTTGLATPPQYFPKNVAMNKGVNVQIDAIISKGTAALDAKTFAELAQQKDILVIDARSPQDYVKGSIEGAWYFGITGGFAPWVGTLIEDLNQKIIFIAPEGRESEVVTRLARVGYDNSLGYLEGGMQAWEEAGYAIDITESISAEDFEKEINEGKVENPLDVRKIGEYQAQHIEGITHLPLSTVHEHVKELDASKRYHIHCAGGYRSLIHASILKSNGIKNVVNIEGGFGAIKKTDIKTTSYVCPSEL
ncbi:MBL fold metallo-hydrolase [Pseudofulvibacter geojedonensis]|uniref:Rhodanese-like domain-containing protein n=1 Tax=Pseudofulvibacter geojedonensis TaxID=1123758 RepID=A0ABW3I5G7_9FLAO